MKGPSTPSIRQHLTKPLIGRCNLGIRGIEGFPEIPRSSVDSELASHARGPWFKSRCVHQSRAGSSWANWRANRLGGQPTTAAILRRCGMSLGKTSTALGAFYRRLAVHIGKAKAITAASRKLALLVYRILAGKLLYIKSISSLDGYRYGSPLRR
jgi:hypothetical protein